MKAREHIIGGSRVLRGEIGSRWVSHKIWRASSRSSYLSSRKIKSAGRPRLTEYRSTRRTKSKTDCDSYIVPRGGGVMVVAATRGGHMLTTFRLFLRLFFILVIVFGKYIYFGLAFFSFGDFITLLLLLALVEFSLLFTD